MSLTEFGVKCGITKSNLIPIEKGRTNVTIETLLKISEAFQVPLKELLPD